MIIQLYYSNAAFQSYINNVLTSLADLLFKKILGSVSTKLTSTAIHVISPEVVAVVILFRRGNVIATVNSGKREESYRFCFNGLLLGRTIRLCLKYIFMALLFFTCIFLAQHTGNNGSF